MKITKKQTLFIGLAFIAVAAVLIALHRYILAAPNVVLAFIFISRYLSVRMTEKQTKLILDAFAKLDVIQDEKRWLGAESDIVLWGAAFVEPGTKGKVTTRELLCRTRRGAWFVIVVGVYKASKLTQFSVLEAHDQAARRILQHDRTLFTKYFALPATV